MLIYNNLYIIYLKIDRPSQHHTENLQPRDLARRQRDRQIGLYHVKKHVKTNEYMICFIITHHILSHTHDFVKTQGFDPKPRFCIDHVLKPRVFPYTYAFSRLWKYKVYIYMYGSRPILPHVASFGGMNIHESQYLVFNEGFHWFWPISLCLKMWGKSTK